MKPFVTALATFALAVTLAAAPAASFGFDTSTLFPPVDYPAPAPAPQPVTQGTSGINK